jgi:hypothetical protein
MKMQWRALKRLRLPFENSERPAGITACNPDRHLIAQHVDRAAIGAIPHYEGLATRMRGNRHSDFLLNEERVPRGC